MSKIIQIADSSNDLYGIDEDGNLWILKKRGPGFQSVETTYKWEMIVEEKKSV